MVYHPTLMMRVTNDRGIFLLRFFLQKQSNEIPLAYAKNHSRVIRVCMKKIIDKKSAVADTPINPCIISKRMITILVFSGVLYIQIGEVALGVGLFILPINPCIIK